MAELPESLYLTAREAAAELGISLATLYAYVSRDMIRSEPVPDSRAKRYRAEDVRALKRRRSAEKPDAAAGSGTLSFGLPVLDSAITLIADGRLHYRGSDATALAKSSNLEQVAALIWGCRDVQPFTRDAVLKPSDRLKGLAAELARTSRIERCLSLLPLAALEDAAVYNMTDRGLATTGARLLRYVAAVIAGEAPSDKPVHEVLTRALTQGEKPASELIRAALVLSADHELNASAFTVRCVAGTGATLYAAVQAGICAAQGPRHGGLSGRVESLLLDMSNRQDVEDAVLQRLKDNDPVPGFGHPLYPDGDPRAAALLSMVAEKYGDDANFLRAQRIFRVMEEAGGLKPNIDFAIATVGAVLHLPRGAGLSIFVLGRTAGWIGHAIEQYRTGLMIRPRARYTGEAPR
ncbi:citrate synthase family protein [Parvibaculum sp.]|uniref:citrate synthase family protein n=1 Tax=Parvibaculum sp. TaxID=2024848 RepID=UPI002730261D|nr:citrate synthase family protein [Parvibaculum sp.]MDP1627451.1 citrate synthase family protein [Parvibaculum sp.]MDP2148630.1 citrate synthase family protein [Parvibaculum sp.]MDP3328139.1 citrate synthase family protein [Parvibaculum sp.]